MSALDNVTHHLVPLAGGMLCAYCNKPAADLGPEPARQTCPGRGKPPGVVLHPVEKMAFTVATRIASRSEPIPKNIAVALLLTVSRLVEGASIEEAYDTDGSELLGG